jgi:endonuclease/exonuclease/phosphatase (EEP) superfamily protein YafD
MKMVRLLRQAVTAVFVIYGLLVAVILAMYFLGRERFVLVQQAQHVMHFITLVTLLMLVAGALIFVRKWMLIALLPGTLMFAVWYGPPFLPKSEPDMQGVEITVATFNVLGHIANPDEVFAVVDALDADVIAFQELRPTLQHKMETHLREEYPHQVSKVIQGFEGLGLISRYPIVESNIELDVDFIEPDLAAPRFLRVVLDVEGRRVVVYGFHPTIPFFEVGRSYDDDILSINVRDMVAQIETETDPVILLCDCNSTPRSIQYAWLDDVLHEAYGARGWGFGLTHPAGEWAITPLFRIDYVWYSDEFEPIAARVWDDSGGSDHYPVLARLDLRVPQ